MQDKTFHRIMTVIAAIGSLSVIALTLYAAHLHSVCSVLSYIANGG